MSDQLLHELRQVGEELRQVFADERRAISTLDSARLEQLAVHKEQLANRLAELRGPALATGLTAVKDLFVAIRIEARATAMLAATATEAVRAMLGYQTNGAYDRRAKQTITVAPRLLTAY
jgi:hypothetical protein